MVSVFLFSVCLSFCLSSPLSPFLLFFPFFFLFLCSRQPEQQVRVSELAIRKSDYLVPPAPLLIYRKVYLDKNLKNVPSTVSVRDCALTILNIFVVSQGGFLTFICLLVGTFWPRVKVNATWFCWKWYWCPIVVKLL